MQRTRTSQSHRGQPRRRPAVSLIEMLLVVAVIIILVSVVLVVGQEALQDTKVKDTKVMMDTVQNAMQAYVEDNPFKNVKSVVRRYGSYPPDDLMAYVPAVGHGQSTTCALIPNLMSGGIGTYFNMNINPMNITDEIDDSNDIAYGDNKALAWALRSHPRAKVFYESIPDRFKIVADTAEEYFDVDGDNVGAVIGQPFENLVDQQVEYLVDRWEIPLEYYSTKQPLEGVAYCIGDSPTTHSAVASALITQNKGLPVLLSYGLDGEFQMAADETLERQYKGNSGYVFDIKSNSDNLFLDDAFAQKLAEIDVP